MATLNRAPIFLEDARELSLRRLIHRLEAATSRLEDIASSSQPPPAQPYDQALHNGSIDQAVNGGAQQRSAPAPIEISVPQHIMAFDEMIQQDLKPFAELSEQLNGIVAEQVESSDEICDLLEAILMLSGLGRRILFSI